MYLEMALKIGRQTVLFPIAIAGRIEAAAAAGLLGMVGIAVALRAAGRGFGECAFGGGRQRALVARLALWLGWFWRLGWHRP